MSVLPFILRKKPARPAAPVRPLGDDDEEIRYRPIDRVLLGRTLQLLAPYKKLYALGLSLGTAQTVLDMLSPKFTQWIIDYGDRFVRSKTAGHLMIAPSAAAWHIVQLVGLWGLVLAGAIVLQRFTILVMTGANRAVGLRSMARPTCSSTKWTPTPATLTAKPTRSTWPLLGRARSRAGRSS